MAEKDRSRNAFRVRAKVEQSFGTLGSECATRDVGEEEALARKEGKHGPT